MASVEGEPLPTKPDCWPLSLPAWLTRSTCTPGTLRMKAQGSREFGILLSSSRLIVVPVPNFLLSTTGVSAVTVMLSSTAATLSEKSRSTLTPVVTFTFRVTVPKPTRLTARV